MRRLTAATALAILFPLSASAVTAADFLDHMNAAERTAFINGAIDMLAYQLSQSREGDKATCLIGWYFEGDGPQHVAATFPQHRDLPAVAILEALANRACD